MKEVATKYENTKSFSYIILLFLLIVHVMIKSYVFEGFVKR